MTEAEWLVSNDPQAMLAHLEEMAMALDFPYPSRRKMRHFAAAWWRTVKPHTSRHEEVCLAIEEKGFWDGGDGISWDTEYMLQHCMSMGSSQTGAALLRCIVGDPWRPPTLCGSCVGSRMFGAPCADCGLIRCWNDGTAHRIAHAIHNNRQWEDAPILADALEEAGCHNAALLDHLRGGGPHARGCWVLDLVLGKS